MSSHLPDSGPQAPEFGPWLRRFIAVRQRIWGWLPAWVRRFLPASAIGFGLLNGFTFAVDLTLLYLLYEVAGLPQSVSLTIAYGVAFSLAFYLNRKANFLSHGNVSAEAGRYVLTVAANFLLFILGVSILLHEVFGWHYQVARVTAGMCEAVFMFCTMKWFIFRAKDRTIINHR